MRRAITLVFDFDSENGIAGEFDVESVALTQRVKSPSEREDYIASGQC